MVISLSNKSKLEIHVSYFYKYLEGFEFSFATRKRKHQYRILCLVRVTSFGVIGKIGDRDILEVRIERNFQKKSSISFKIRSFLRKNSNCSKKVRRKEITFISLSPYEKENLWHIVLSWL